MVTAFDPSCFDKTDPESVRKFIRHAHACSSEGFCLFCRVRLTPYGSCPTGSIDPESGQTFVGRCHRCGNEYLHAKVDIEAKMASYDDAKLLEIGDVMDSELRRFGLL